MTDIQPARDALKKWRTASDRLRPMPWSMAPIWGGVLITDGDGSQVNSDDQEEAAEFNGPVAALIVGATDPDLLDAIDAFLGMVASYELRDRQGHAGRIAAAILAADERMSA